MPAPTTFLDLDDLAAMYRSAAGLGCSWTIEPDVLVATAALLGELQEYRREAAEREAHEAVITAERERNEA